MRSCGRGNRRAGAKNRNWNASNVIETFFGASAAIEMGRSGETAFKKQLYQSMVAQALFLKTEIEGWRSQNVFGTTIWMCVYRRRFPYQCCHMPLSVRVSGNSYQDYHVFFLSSQVQRHVALGWVGQH